MYSRSMYNVSLRILGNSTDAEDAMQEAFLNAFRKLDTYSGNVSFGAWLRRIVINRSLDYLKKRKVKFEEISERSVGIVDDEPGPAAVDMASIHKAIQELPDGYRVVLSLHLIEGYEHEEIGRILQISSSASRTQYLRAKNKLKELLKNRELYIYN
jgi:RNA polymerase sigma-70 factor (ECF subfamily)